MADSPGDDITTSTGEPQPWYADGLQFDCLWPECTACCGGQPGFVWITMEEAEALAAEVGMDLETFLSQYCREIGSRMSLVEVNDGTHNCILLGKTGCTVYQSRPAQCQAYPFWPEVVKSQQTWDEERRFCPGIGRGRIWSLEEIEAKRATKPERKPFWYDKKTIDDIRRQLLDTIRDNVAEKRAEYLRNHPEARPKIDDDEWDLPWTDPVDDDE